MNTSKRFHKLQQTLKPEEFRLSWDFEFHWQCLDIDRSVSIKIKHLFLKPRKRKGEREKKKEEEEGKERKEGRKKFTKRKGKQNEFSCCVENRCLGNK